MKKAITSLLLVSTSALLTVFALELALRAFTDRPRLGHGVYLVPELSEPDADLIGVAPWLKDAAYFNSKGAGTAILALGDSFTEGYPVPRARSYPRQLEEILQAGGCDVHVVNAGLGDSGLGQQLKLLTKYILPAANFDVVVWSFYANDVFDEATKPVFDVSPDGELQPVPAERNWIYLRSLIYANAPLPRRVKDDSYLFRLLLKPAERYMFAQVPAGYSGDYRAWSRRKIPLLVEKMKRLAEANNFHLYLLLIQPQSVYLARSSPDRWNEYDETLMYRQLEEILAGQPNVIRAAWNTTDGIFSGPDRDRNPEGTRHFNETGYRLMAEKVAERLIRDGVTKACSPEVVSLP